MTQSTSVVIIEDSPVQAHQLAELLQSYGMQTYIADDGMAGLKLVREQSPDVVLLDVLLPSMDGFQVCRRLKRTELTDNIRVIMFTAASGSDDERFGFHSGADAYVTKGEMAHHDLLVTLEQMGLLHAPV